MTLTPGFMRRAKMNEERIKRIRTPGLIRTPRTASGMRSAIIKLGNRASVYRESAELLRDGRVRDLLKRGYRLPLGGYYPETHELSNLNLRWNKKWPEGNKKALTTLNKFRNVSGEELENVTHSLERRAIEFDETRDKLRKMLTQRKLTKI